MKGEGTRKLITLTIIAMLLSPILTYASDDLESRITALEERVSILESQINGTQNETEYETGEMEMTENGCTLTFKRFEISKDYSDQDIVILYFDFLNDSGRTASADHSFEVKVFQNNKEQPECIAFDNGAGRERYTEYRSGADPVEVAYASDIQDMSDIIVNISNPFISNGDDFVEFSLSLE